MAGGIRSLLERTVAEPRLSEAGYYNPLQIWLPGGGSLCEVYQIPFNLTRLEILSLQIWFRVTARFVIKLK